MQHNRIGIDLGGSKTEIVVLGRDGIKWQKRIPTPSANYHDILAALVSLAAEAWQVAPGAPIGIGMPGAVTSDGLIKNSNTVCLNGKPFPHDIEKALGCPVRIMNDANCFTLSEAVDGAAADADAVNVWGVIIGTGVGGGLVINGQTIHGANAIAGEWGHNALCRRAPRAADVSRHCYCGRQDCVETYLNGKGLSQTYQELHGEYMDAMQIGEALLQEDVKSQQAFSFYTRQLAASLAVVINIADPDAIVLGGGLSNLPGLAEAVERRLPDYVFSPTIATRIVTNHHGDASGVRGAAWLWPLQEEPDD